MAFFPPRILSLNIQDIQGTDTWTIDDGTGDPWVGYPYRFQVTMDVSAQSHSSHLTATPFYYNGADVRVGDWISDIVSGQALRIVEILEQAPERLVLVGEDVDRFNIFTDPTQSGNAGLSIGQGYIFQIGDDGLPILSPLTANEATLRANSAWQLDMISRFRFRNYLRSHYPVHQAGHEFVVGDFLVLGTEGYEKAAADDYVEGVVGTVTAIGIPGGDWFNYRPVGRVVENLDPALPGEPGDLIFLAPNGSLSLTKPTAWAKPMYIRLETGNKAIVLDRGVDSVNKNGYSSQTYVVNSIAARDALTDLNVGDQALVKNMGNGEWSHYIFEAGDEWTLLVTQDASNVDSASKQITVTYQSDPTSIIAAVSTGRRIDEVVIQVKEAFDGVASIMVGTDAKKDWFMTADQNDLAIVGDYKTDPACILKNNGADSLVKYWLSTSGCTKGKAIVSVTYS